MAERLWTTRDAGPADIDGILALRQTTFGDVDPLKLRPDVWRWTYVENPAGAGFIRVAEHAGRIVGHYAAMPVRFQVGAGESSRRIFAMSCDTMTHPDYQKQGMFVTLARELYAGIANRHGVETVFGFPNDASHVGFVGKLDWFDVHVFPLRVKPIRSGPVLRRWVRSPALSGALGAVADGAYRLVTPRAHEPRRCRIEPIDRFDERFDALWERQPAIAPVMQLRDRAFLQWRYFGVPLYGYRPFAVSVDGELVGWFVLRVLELFDLPFAALVDVFPCPLLDDGITREVLAFAQLRAAEAGAAFLTAMLPPAHAHHLTRFGFVTVPDRLNPRRWFLGARSTGADAALLRRIDNWWVTFGDADVI